MKSLSPLVQNFVLRFGEMGSRRGINRNVRQNYARLYVPYRPLNAAEIADVLDFSRSKVSMGLKKLESWRRLRPPHLPGTGMNFFAHPKTFGRFSKTLAEERKKREIDPTLAIRDAVINDVSGAVDKHTQPRMKSMHGLIELISGRFTDVPELDQHMLMQRMKPGFKVHKLPESKGQLKIVAGGKKI